MRCDESLESEKGALVEGFAMVPRSVLEMMGKAGISNGAQATLFALASFRSAKTPDVWPSLKMISEILNRSTRQIKRDIRELKKEGLLKYKRRGPRSLIFSFSWDFSSTGFPQEVKERTYMSPYLHKEDTHVPLINKKRGQIWSKEGTNLVPSSLKKKPEDTIKSVLSNSNTDQPVSLPAGIKKPATHTFLQSLTSSRPATPGVGYPPPPTIHFKWEKPADYETSIAEDLHKIEPELNEINSKILSADDSRLPGRGPGSSSHPSAGTPRERLLKSPQRRKQQGATERKGQKRPSDQRETIEGLLGRYTDSQRHLVLGGIEDCAATRKGGKITDSVKMRILRQLDRYPADIVEDATHKYLDNGYSETGKNERYWLGIVRGTVKEREARAKLDNSINPSTQWAWLGRVYSKTDMELMAEAVEMCRSRHVAPDAEKLDLLTRCRKDRPGWKLN